MIVAVDGWKEENNETLFNLTIYVCRSRDSSGLGMDISHCEVVIQTISPG